MNQSKIYLFFVFLFTIINTNELWAQEELLDYSEKLVPFSNAEGKWGYMDVSTKNIVIEPKYDVADLFNQKGVAKVTKYQHVTDNQEDAELTVWIDSTGKELFKPQFFYFTQAYFTDNKTHSTAYQDYKEVTDINGRKGVIKMNGDWLIPLQQTDDIQVFNERNYLINKTVFYSDGKKYTAPNNSAIYNVDFDNRWFYVQGKDEIHNGIVSWEGKLIVPLDYIRVTYYPNAKRFIAIQMKDSIEIKDINGNEKIVCTLLDEYSNKIKIYETDYELDLVNDSLATYELNKIRNYVRLSDGAEVSEEDVDIAQLGYSIFSDKNLFGLKNKDRKITIPAQYSILQSLENGFFEASKSFAGKIGVVDINNKKIIPFVYDNIFYSRDEHLFIASKNGKYGALNEIGTIVIPFKYQYQLNFRNGRAQVSENNKKGIINTKEKIIVPIEYDDIYDTKEIGETESVYYKVSKNNVWGLMDSLGKLIVPIEYGYVSFGGGNLPGYENWIQTEDKERQYRGLYNFKTKVSIPPKYKYASPYSDCAIVNDIKNDENIYQLIDENGKPLTTLPYTGMLHSGDYIIVQLNDKNGVIDTKGKTLIEPVYDYIWGKTPHLIIAKKENKVVYINVNGMIYEQ